MRSTAPTHLTDRELETAIEGKIADLPHVKLNHLMYCPDCGGVVELERKERKYAPLIEGLKVQGSTIITPAPASTPARTPQPVASLYPSTGGYQPYKGSPSTGWTPYSSNPNRCPQCKSVLATDECIVEKCFGCDYDLSQCDEETLEKIRREANVQEEWDGKFGPREAFDPPLFPRWAALSVTFALGMVAAWTISILQ